MQILSVEFALFCGAVLFLYYHVPGRIQWILLLGASYLFYGSYGLENLGYMLLTTLSTYAAAAVIHHYQLRFDKKEAKRKGKPWLLACLICNFGMLFICKVNLLRGGLLPLGISYYLFQSMGYLIDVYRMTQEPQRNPGKLALFVSYFPQLIQGPISRASVLLPQLTDFHPYNGKQVSFGLQRILWGCFKKLVIAQRVAPAVLVLRESGSMLTLSILYAIQIYGDFTGGIDIALGLSEALGIRLPENFCRPFFAKNTAEFWRRWHITLGEWMKNYIFYPISVSKPMGTLSKAARKRLGKVGKRLPVYAASMVTWLATGIWHGLTPNFILWGMMNCAVIVISGELTPLYGKLHGRFHLKEQKWYGGFEILRTFLLMNLIRLADLFPDTGEYFGRMGELCSFPQPDYLEVPDWGVLIPGILLMLGVSLIQEKHGSVRALLWQKHWLLRCSLIFGLFLAVLILGCYGPGYDAGNFIYSQF